MAASQCTGLTAYWCPVHGDCTCERLENGDCCFDDQSCPLHSDDSSHPDSVGLELCRERVQAVAESLSIELRDHDEAVLSQFALWLHERAAQGKGTP